MFREMRRNDKAKTREEAEAILKKCTNGVLSVSGDDDYPYGVPVSYTFHDNKIFIHGATVGHKLDSIRRNPKVCFTVVGADNVPPDKFTTVYSSVICFGKATIVEDREQKHAVLAGMVEKYHSQFREGGMKYIDAKIDGTTIIIIDVEHMTAKGLAK